MLVVNTPYAWYQRAVSFQLVRTSRIHSGSLEPCQVANHSIVKLGACCAGLSLLAACSGTSAAPARGRGGEGGAVPVVVAKVAAKDVPVDLEGIGNVEAYSIISVRAQVT